LKFFFGLLAFIAATVVVVLLVISLFRSLGDTSTTTSTTSSYSFDDTSASDSIVRYRIEGPVVADENHREVRITVSKSARTIDIIKGYKGTVEKTETYPNNEQAYQAFLGALEAARFTYNRGEITADTSTTCVTGSKYHYELTDLGQKKVDTWTTSCSVEQGNFAGNHQAVADLFRKQIPNYSKLTTGINLSAR
jgi:hypothetical protein